MKSLLFLLLLPMSLHSAPPPTQKQTVTDEYHGIRVVDEYRWLEDAASPEVKAWTSAQNAFSRDWLDSRPGRAAIETTLKTMYERVTPSYTGLVGRPGVLFALKLQPPKQQRLLVTLRSAEILESERVVLDPNTLEPKGQVAMDWYVPSPDGSLVAVCLSENGSEDGTLYFYRTATGEALPDRIPRVQYPTGGGSAAWKADGSGVWYTRYPHAGERAAADMHFYQQVYFHRLGTPTQSDRYSVGADFPRIAEIHLEASEDGGWILASVANGDGGEYSHHLCVAREDATWRQLARHEDGIKSICFSPDGRSLYARSVKDAPRGRVLRFATEGTLGGAEVVVPESEAVLEGVLPTSDALFVVDMIGGPSRIRKFDLQGNYKGEVPVPVASGIGGLLSFEGGVLFRQTSFVAPAAWMWHGGEGAGVRRMPLSNTAPVDFSDIEVEREFATSRDGTRVPITILRRKGTPLDGSNPVLLTGYGGYGISMRPGLAMDQRLWFDRGGVYVVANLRGGGEYGEEWHLAGNLTHKQNVFDDFAACANHLIRSGFTRPERLAVEGGSNGGLLMGALLTQHPGLVRAVVAHVGIFDMLRVELDPNGAFNVTEFGSVKDPSQFRALFSYSPFHQVKDGVAYPAVFLLAGETDGRVNPAHSRRMAARLQAATGSGYPVLARLSSASGHGMGTALSEKIAQQADVFAFLFDQLGMELRGIQ